MARDYDAISRFNEDQLGKDRRSRLSQVAMYADTAHFVYELLQNADDAGATEIAFRLTADQLVVEHNGKSFDEFDVKAISYFGKGKTDVTAIGHFGLGFKSVFAYTASPRIHSTDDDFELVDLYTLRAIPRPTDLKRGRTRFSLAFDHYSKKPVYVEASRLKRPERAREEIGRKLRDLGGGTLLFTRTLREIQWADGREDGHYLREDTTTKGGGRESLIVSDSSNDQYFLSYDRKIAWPDDDGQLAERRPISVAVRLDKPIKNGGRACGEENEKLWVFFPTDKETHMGLIIQGPYRTTPARDNVPPDDEFNQFLIGETALLLSESLGQMRRLGAVTPDLLSRLPIEEAFFEEGTFFRPIFDAVRRALRDEPLLPTNKGKYVSAKHAKLARGQRLTELLSANQLSQLFGREDMHWLDASITADNFPKLYRYLVGTKQYSWSTDWLAKPLAANIEVRLEDIAAKLSKKFLEEQPDSWIISFYKFLNEGRTNYNEFLQKPIIRLENGQHVAPFNSRGGAPNAFLPTDAESDLPVVKGSIAKNRVALEFLKTIGLQEPDIVDEVIEKILPRYAGKGAVPVPVWKKDIKKMLVALGSAEDLKRDRLKERMRACSCLLVQPLNSEELSLVSPGSAYVLSDDLREYFQGNKAARFLATGYYDQSQLGTLEGLGVARLPRVSAQSENYLGYVTLANYHGWHKRGLDSFDPEWTVDGLKEVLASPTAGAAAVLWNHILPKYAHNIRGIVESSSRKTFEGSKRKPTWSTVGDLLRDTQWLPDGHGGLHKPSALTLTELPIQFERESIAAKRVAELLGMRQPETVRAIEAISGGNERVRGIIERLARGDLDDAILDKLDKLLPHGEAEDNPPPSFKAAMGAMHREGRNSATEREGHGESGIQNPDRYSKKLAEEIENKKTAKSNPAQARFSVIREREDSREAREFLYQQYGGKCQVSGETFPKANGKNYFVAVSLVPHQGASYLNHAGNMLCLSADSAARFMYGTFVWIDDIGAKVEAFRPASSGGQLEDRQIRIRIAGEETTISFTEAHFLRLKALWESG
jgi:hypothetical protein